MQSWQPRRPGSIALSLFFQEPFQQRSATALLVPAHLYLHRWFHSQSFTHYGELDVAFVLCLHFFPPNLRLRFQRLYVYGHYLSLHPVLAPVHWHTLTSNMDHYIVPIQIHHFHGIARSKQFTRFRLFPAGTRFEFFLCQLPLLPVLHVPLVERDQELN